MRTCFGIARMVYTNSLYHHAKFGGEQKTKTRRTSPTPWWHAMTDPLCGGGGVRRVFVFFCYFVTLLHDKFVNATSLPMR